jgi:hypothetical protein
VQEIQQATQMRGCFDRLSPKSEVEISCFFTECIKRVFDFPRACMTSVLECFETVFGKDHILMSVETSIVDRDRLVHPCKP